MHIMKRMDWEYATCLFTEIVKKLTEYSLPCSHERANDPNPEQEESSLHFHTLFF